MIYPLPGELVLSVVGYMADKSSKVIPFRTLCKWVNGERKYVVKLQTKLNSMGMVTPEQLGVDGRTGIWLPYDQDAEYARKWGLSGLKRSDCIMITRAESGFSRGRPSRSIAISAYNSGGESDKSDEKVGTPDGMPPSTAAILDGVKGSGDWFTSDVSVKLESQDDNSGPASTEYSLNVIQGSSVLQSTYGFVPYTAPLLLSEGIYQLQYRSTAWSK